MRVRHGIILGLWAVSNLGVAEYDFDFSSALSPEYLDFIDRLPANKIPFYGLDGLTTADHISLYFESDPLGVLTRLHSGRPSNPKINLFSGQFYLNVNAKNSRKTFIITKSRKTDDELISLNFRVANKQEFDRIKAYFQDISAFENRMTMAFYRRFSPFSDEVEELFDPPYGMYDLIENSLPYGEGETYGMIFYKRKKNVINSKSPVSLLLADMADVRRSLRLSLVSLAKLTQAFDKGAELRKEEREIAYIDAQGNQKIFECF